MGPLEIPSATSNTWHHGIMALANHGDEIRGLTSETNKKLWKMAIEIGDLPTEHDDI